MRSPSLVLAGLLALATPVGAAAQVLINLTSIAIEQVNGPDPAPPITFRCDQSDPCDASLILRLGGEDVPALVLARQVPGNLRLRLVLLDPSGRLLADLAPASSANALSLPFGGHGVASRIFQLSEAPPAPHSFLQPPVIRRQDPPDAIIRVTITPLT